MARTSITRAVSAGTSTGKSATTQLALTYSILSLMAACSMLATYWLWQQPNLLASDDALFFSRGINRFSTLEFSPHFPGYPAYLWLNKLFDPLFNHSVDTLLSISRISVLLLPWLSFLLLRQLGLTVATAAVAFFLCLSDPIILGLGSQGLSEAPALCWLAAGSIAIVKQRFLISGALIGLCLATRPSYLPVLVPLLLWLAYQERTQLTSLLFGCCTIAVLSLLYVFTHDGLGYFQEALRFIQGHFSLWGNSIVAGNQSNSWGFAIIQYMGWIAVIGVMLTAFILLTNWFKARLFTRCSEVPVPPHKLQALMILSLLLVAATVWTLMAQNPDNLRHLVAILWPLYCLISLLFSQLKSYSAKGLAVASLCVCQSLLLSNNLTWQASSPPIQQAIKWLESQPTKLVASNKGIELLRSNLPSYIVADSFYPGNIERILDKGGFRLSSSPITHDDLEEVTHFKKRSPAEHDLRLYRLKP